MARIGIAILNHKTIGSRTALYRWKLARQREARGERLRGIDFAHRNQLRLVQGDEPNADQACSGYAPGDDLPHAHKDATLRDMAQAVACRLRSQGLQETPSTTGSPSLSCTYLSTSPSSSFFWLLYPTCVRTCSSTVNSSVNPPSPGGRPCLSPCSRWCVETGWTSSWAERLSRSGVGESFSCGVHVEIVGQG